MDNRVEDFILTVFSDCKREFVTDVIIRYYAEKGYAVTLDPFGAVIAEKQLGDAAAGYMVTCTVMQQEQIISVFRVSVSMRAW